MGIDPLNTPWRHPFDDDDGDGDGTAGAGPFANQNVQIFMMHWQPNEDENEDQDDKDKKKQKMEEQMDRQEALEQKLKTTPTLVTERDKRRYRHMMNTIMKRGQRAAENKNVDEERKIWAMWTRARWWIHLKRTLARMAREKEGETRRQAPEEEMYYGAYDFTGPAPDAMVDAMEADWLEEIEAELETQSLEEIFPELSMEELEAFEPELIMLGYEDDGDWAVGIDP